MPNASFERDFGYLFPFFNRLEQAAATLSPHSRDELLALLTGERERWARVQALLAGEAGMGARVVGEQASNVATALHWTVGALGRR
jgi:hypothetical protein